MADNKKSIPNRIWRRIVYVYSIVFINAYKKLRTTSGVMWFLNRKSQSLYKSAAHNLSPLASRIVKDLERDGLSFTSLDELFPTEAVLQKIQAYVSNEFTKADIGTRKKFLAYLWNNAPVFDFGNPICSISIRGEITKAANAYIGLYSRFTFFSVNRTIVGSGDAAGSQRWHRDPSAGDERMVKVFIYLNDVLDTGTGPFMYVMGSLRTGRWGHLHRPSQPWGIYPPDNAVEDSEMKSDITACTGRAGTVIFCDTTGLHKGGYSTTKERVMATLYYVSPGSHQNPNFRLSETAEKTLEILPAEEARLFGR